MAFNFPDAPSEGLVWTDTPSGAQYVYKSGVWMQSSAAQIKLSALPRNRLVNPAMQISQDLALDAAVTATNSYIGDQWLFYYVSSGFTPAVRIVVGGSGHKDIGNFLRTASGSVVDTSIAAGDFLTVRQPIEGKRVADFNWGTANAKPVVLRFLARSTLAAGTFCVALRSGDGGAPSFVKNCVITAANAWQEFVIPIPGCTTGTWPIDNTLGASLNFTIIAGTTYNGATDNTWNAAGGLATTAISNWAATASQNFEFANVGLYLDPDATRTAPPWEMPDEAEELAACFRYFVDTRTFNASNNVIGIGLTYSATLADALFEYPVQMRVIPVIAFSGAWNATGAGGGTVAATPGTPTPQNQRYAFCRVTASGLISGGTTWVYTTNSAARCQANARM